jgi:hypothetical protein
MNIHRSGFLEKQAMQAAFGRILMNCIGMCLTVVTNIEISAKKSVYVTGEATPRKPKR